MAGQNIERREILRALSIAAGVAGSPGFVKWTFAFPQEHTHRARSGKTAASPKSFQPQFFSPSEYAMLTTLCELIIPTDDTPGAREAGVNEFLDFIVQSDPNLQYPFRSGLRWLDAHASYSFDKGFRELNADRQTELLRHLAYRNLYRAGEEDGQAFFRLLREYVVIGFYTSQIGMKELDHPNLQQYRREMPGCSHDAVADPRHKNLTTQ